MALKTAQVLAIVNTKRFESPDTKICRARKRGDYEEQISCIKQARRSFGYGFTCFLCIFILHNHQNCIKAMDFEPSHFIFGAYTMEALKAMTILARKDSI